MTKTAAPAAPVDYTTDGERPGGTPAGPGVDIPHDAMSAIQQAENETRARLKAEKRVERVIPRIRPDKELYVGVNGVGMRIPFGRKVMLPESIAAQVDAAVAGYMKSHPND